MRDNESVTHESPSWCTIVVGIGKVSNQNEVNGQRERERDEGKALAFVDVKCI